MNRLSHAETKLFEFSLFGVRTNNGTVHQPGMDVRAALGVKRFLICRAAASLPAWNNWIGVGGCMSHLGRSVRRMCRVPLKFGQSMQPTELRSGETEKTRRVHSFCGLRQKT